MPITVTDVTNAIDAAPTTLVPASYLAGPNPTFKWHRNAKPAPVYWLCLVQITAITTPDQITVKCFRRDGTTWVAMDVNLVDWNHAWRTSPSTIGTVPATLGELGANTCGVLCLSDALLKKYNAPADVGFAKYPYADDALVAENAKLLAAIATLRTEVDAEFFKQTIDHLKLGNLNLNA